MHVVIFCIASLVLSSRQFTMLSKRKLSCFGVLLTAVIFQLFIRITKKNTCSSYLDYLLINFSGNCHYNPDADLSVPELIEKYAHNVSIYNATTEDGYTLRMFRIMQDNPVGVVLLQPPLSAHSIIFLSNGDESIALNLWRKGYDVWLANHRGTAYSRGHVNLTTSDSQYWNYSFHEIALYDLDVQLEVVRNHTNNAQIIFIGYSMGATEALVYASLKPERCKEMIKSFILIAPTTVMSGLTGPMNYALHSFKTFEKYVGAGEFLAGQHLRWLGQVTTASPLVAHFLLPFLMGLSSNEPDPAQYSYFFAHHGVGITNKMISHFAQTLSNGGHFRMYDYGNETNTNLYGTYLPPDYPLKKVTTSVYFIYGDKDLLATPTAVEILCKLLPKNKVQGKVLIPDSNHIDFLFTKYVRNKTYESIYQILDQIQS